MTIYKPEEMEQYKTKVSRTIAKAQHFKEEAIKLRISLEDDAKVMENIINSLRVKYPEMPKAKDLNTVPEYTALLAAIKKLNKVIEKAQDNNDYKEIADLQAINAETEIAIKGVLEMLEAIAKSPEFDEYIKSGIS